MTAPLNLGRFVDAQERDYPSVLEELRAGQKRSHWIWYIFPQIEGLGGSPMSRTYAICSRDEAKAYSEHPVLGPRLRECTQLVVNVEGRSAEQIFPYPDNLKFRSCMTLFERSAADPTIFRAALLKYFAGKGDRLTLEILERKAASRREPT
jgi:uncharacterized protein (DUF1810 family)